MLRVLMVGGLAGALMMLLMGSGDGDGGATSEPAARGRPGAAPPGTHGVPGTPPHLRPDQIEKRISPDERERLGLAERTWVAQHGKVHPDVRDVLQTGEMPWLRFKGWAPIGFEGTAYVAVYLRDEQRGRADSPENQAAIKGLQARVLSRLTAAEFSVVYTFRNTAGVLGYVSSEGLGKLVKDQDVVAVGLDDKPLAEDPPRAVHEPGPPPKRGERPRPTEWVGKIEAQVYKALEKDASGYVFVIVGVPGAGVGSGPFEQTYDARQGERRAAQDRVLSALTAEEFRARTRGAVLTGYASAGGLKKLAEHPDVVAVGLDMVATTAGNLEGRRN